MHEPSDIKDETDDPLPWCRGSGHRGQRSGRNTKVLRGLQLGLVIQVCSGFEN